MPAGHLATWHWGICPCCGYLKPLTEPRDYRYPKLKVLYEYREAVDALGQRHEGGVSNGVDRSEREAEQSTPWAISKI